MIMKFFTLSEQIHCAEHIFSESLIGLFHNLDDQNQCGNSSDKNI